MNLSTGKSNRVVAMLATIACATASALAFPRIVDAAGKGLDVEIMYEIKALKSTVVAPFYLDSEGSNIIVTDKAGGLYSVTMAGATKSLAGKDKLKNPGGVAIAPTGFGSNGGNYFVLNAADPKASCEVMKVDKSGAVSSFAKLPDGASDCRALKFGRQGTPFAGKLYAATSGNSTVYAIDSSGAAKAFGTFDKPAMELTTINFTGANDPKSANSMLLGMRPKNEVASKVGRFANIGTDGSMKDVYLVGFGRPSGIDMSPSGFGTYANEVFMADMGKPYAESQDRDGSVLRLEKGIPRPYASGLMDPTDMKFVGNKIVICDPNEKGAGQGAIVVISSMI